eukprot:scaffold12.g8055.t1
MEQFIAQSMSGALPVFMVEPGGLFMASGAVCQQQKPPRTCIICGTTQSCSWRRAHGHPKGNWACNRCNCKQRRLRIKQAQCLTQVQELLAECGQQQQRAAAAAAGGLPPLPCTGAPSPFAPAPPAAGASWDQAGASPGRGSAISPPTPQATYSLRTAMSLDLQHAATAPCGALGAALAGLPRGAALGGGGLPALQPARSAELPPLAHAAHATLDLQRTMSMPTHAHYPYGQPPHARAAMLHMMLPSGAASAAPYALVSYPRLPPTGHCQLLPAAPQHAPPPATPSPFAAVQGLPVAPEPESEPVAAPAAYAPCAVAGGVPAAAGPLSVSGGSFLNSLFDGEWTAADDAFAA